MLRYANDNEANQTQKERGERSCCSNPTELPIAEEMLYRYIWIKAYPERAESVCERDCKRTRLRLHLDLLSILAAYWW